MKEFCCMNENCPKHGIRGGDNIRLRAWYGKNKDMSHIRQDLTDAIEVLKNVKQIVEEYYKK